MPVKHKEKNTIKFLRFSERISNINVDVIHRVGHRNEEDDVGESESHFYVALLKWNELNCSQGWKEFVKEVSGVRSLAQVLLLKDKLVSSLIRHLEKRDPLAIQAILEMTVALARDLRKDFYPYYHDILIKVVNLLGSKEVDVLEWSFQCLAYLFKFLWRCMVRNVEQVLSSLLPLLSPKHPKYVNYFAADSFAFLARKVRNQISFVCLILDHLKNQPEDVAGCGRLVFAWMRGIKGQLHSNAQSLLLLLFRSLGTESLSTDLLESLLAHTLTYLCVDIRPGGLVFLWEAIDASLVQFSSDQNTNWDAATRALRLAYQVCQHNEAIHLTSPNQFITRLLFLFSKSELPPENVVSKVADIVAVLLLSPTASVSQQHAVKLTSQVMSSNYHHITFSFVEKLLHWGSFELLLLPRLLRILSEHFFHNCISYSELQVLAQLVHFKAPPLSTASDVANASMFELDFCSATDRLCAPAVTLSEKLLEVLMVSEDGEQGVLSTLEEKICSLIILPHVKPLNKKEALKVLQKHLLCLFKEIEDISHLCKTCDEVSSSANVTQLSHLLLMLLASFEAAIRILGTEKCLDEIADVDMVLQTLVPLACQSPFSLSSLRALNIYFEMIDIQKIVNKVQIIYGSLSSNLQTAYHLVREMTCRIFLQLPVNAEIHSIFLLCLEAEKIEASITDYRGKLQYLKRLSYESTRSSFGANKDFQMAPLCLIFGSLYINFKLLWEPLQALIASYALGMSRSEFWPIFHEQLVQSKSQRNFSSDHGAITRSSFECSLLSQYFSFVNDVDDKPDYPHYRLLLWQAMQQFPEVCEKYNKDIVSLFLSFMENEYYRSDVETAVSWNIKNQNQGGTEVPINNTEMEDSDENMDSVSEEADSDDETEFQVQVDSVGKKQASARKNLLLKKVKAERTLSSRLLTRTLLAQLGLLAKMRSPLTMHRESELNRVYHDLLSHKNQAIQKAAFECIMTYKHKYLMPYSQHLLALIDNKSYKTEMLSFCISQDSEMITPEHRPQLIPLIIKIVYSKMTAKTGMRTGGKSSLAARRSSVLRFLAGCQEEEMLLFIEMAFRFYSHLLKDDPISMCRSIQSSIDLENVIHPRRLQSSVNLLSVVLEQFGGLMSRRLLALILRLLICVGATVKCILNKREDVHISYHNPLRLLRNSCLEVLTQFFDRFEAYPWSTSEIDSVLDVFVWPLIERLPFEGVYSPTALMKLLTVWSQHPRYFILFGVHSPVSTDLSTLPALMALLLSPKSHPSVCNAVIEVLENLLTLKDHEHYVENANAMDLDDTFSEERAPSIPVSYILPVEEGDIQKLNLSVTPNLGSKLLYPHVSLILEKLRQRLATSSSRGIGLTKRELLVLNAVSEFVSTPATSATLAQLLLPILSRRTGSVEDEEPVLKMMNTLFHLFKRVEEPQSYIRQIAPLFSCINGVAGRKMLVSLINVIKEAANTANHGASDDLNLLASIVCKLNAYDARWVEQPDFDKRLEAFKEVQTLSQARKLTVDLGVIVIYHCFYTIRSEKDLSLRDFASHCLRHVAPKLCLDFKNDSNDCKYLVDNTILALIRNSINKTTPEALQGEAVLLLGEMARECCDLHPVLKDLHLLTNKSDPEVDFFENLQHLQLHRKTRALLKVCDIFSHLEKAPGTRTLTHFILPLTAQFLCSEKYLGKNSLTDAAINVVGVVCHLLPWHQYEAMLRVYLGRLRLGALYQKQLVRIVATILDSFHFDLSRAEMTGLLKYKKVSNNKADEEGADRQTSENSIVCEIGGSKLSDSIGNMEQDLENLEQLPHSAEDMEETEMDAEEQEEAKAKFAIAKQAVLCPSAATRAIRTILVGLLPQLNRTLTARTVLENSHKVNKKQIKNCFDKDVEEEEMLKVPMAFAVVKLLKQLPSEMLNQNLPGIFARLCMFLKSRLESVRKITRETLQKVMVSLGPSYLDTLLHEMTSLLTRGFEVHVLVFCIHSVLVSLRDTFSAGEIDSSVASIIDVCKTDLFGCVAEEREEGKISSRVREARSSKSYDTLRLVSQFVDENHLTNVLLPFKEVILSARSHKVINKASECLRHIVLGLSDNVFISPSSLMIFAYGVASESIPTLSFKNKKVDTATEEEKDLKARRRPDCFIIPEAPKHHIGIKSTDAARVAARTNAHLFVGFGLHLVHTLLRREKFKESEVDVRTFLDPIVTLLSDCLSSQHVKLCTLSLQCLVWLFLMDLPALKKQMPAITSSIFSLLHKFAATGLSKGDNFDLVVAGFKTVSVIVRDVKYHTLEQDQLKALLLYAEQDFTDINRHATAFALMKAILSRKLIVPEIHDVMDRIATLSITSEASYVRQQARSVFYQFLMDYPLGGKMKRHLSFFLSQLNFELKTGRESALEMVHSIVSSFPLSKLTEHCELFFLMLGARLINDDSPDCRKMVAQSITKMLSRLEKTHRDRLYNMNLLWLRDKHISHRQLAAQLCGFFVEIEKKSFRGRLMDLLPIIVSQFSPVGNITRNDSGKEAISNALSQPDTSESKKTLDHHLFQVLQLILKICNHCPDWLVESSLSDYVYDITEHISSLLAHPHEWVRLASVQILTHILNAIDSDSLSEALQEGSSVHVNNLGFFRTDTRSRVRSMILDHCAQLKAGIDVEQELLFQVVKNLVIFSDVLKNLSVGEKHNDNEDSKQFNLSLPWLVRRMRRIFNAEVTQAPQSTVMRTMVLNWTAAILVKLGSDTIRPVLHDLLAPIVRERSNDESPAEGSSQARLRSLAKEVGSLMKKTVGADYYIQTQSRLQILLSSRRAERKKILKLEAVTEPEKAAKRKAQKQARKKGAKKRRTMMMKGKNSMKFREVSLGD